MNTPVSADRPHGLPAPRARLEATMTNPSKLRSLILAPATIGAALLAGGVVASTAAADDITPILTWGFSADGGLTAPDPAYRDAYTNFALGEHHGVAIVAPGYTVIGWGRSASGQTTAPALSGGTTYTFVAAGENHTALLRSDGVVVCVGSNALGQCDVPVGAPAFDMVRCGSNFTLARNADFDLVAWGDNAAGQTTLPAWGATADDDVTDFAGGLDHGVALLRDGRLVFWGDNSEGEQTPPVLGGGLTVTDVACAWNTTAYLLSDGTVQVVGDNTLLQQNVPALGTGETYSSLRAGGYTFGARRSDGVTVVWGNTSNDLDVPPATPAGTVFIDFQVGVGFAASLFTLDCDDDGVSDRRQIGDDPTLDCNADLRLDSCEDGVFAYTSGTVAPFNGTTTVTTTGTDLPDALDAVTIEVEVKADLGSPGEYLQLAFNGQVIDYIFLQGGTNCPSGFQKETIFVPAAMFNEMLDDGDAVFTLNASPLVSQDECPTSAAKVRFSYVSDSIDCNGNGEPDVCELDAGEIADVNGDGVPDSCQLTPTGDIDGDRKGDILWFNPGSRQFAAWFMSGLTRTAGGVFTVTAPSGFSFGGTGDLDGDGRADFVLRNTTTGAVRGLLCAGTTVVEEGNITGVVPEDYRLLAVVDTDGDGNDDILWKSATTGKVYGWLMHGLTKLDSGEIGSTTGLTYLGAGDLDSDGDADLLWRNTSFTVSGWLMNGLTIQSQADVANAGPVFADWSPTGMADLSGDGKADLLWRNTDTGQLNCWLMDGLTKGAGSGTVTSSVSLVYTVAALVDLDGDSKADIVWRNTNNGDVNAWLMDGLTKRSGGFVRGVTLDWRMVNP